MPSKLSDLASRIKDAVNEEESARVRAEAEARTRAEQEGRRREAMIGARRELLDDLKVFGRALDVLDVIADASGVTFGYGGRRLRFDAEPEDGSIDVHWDGTTEDEVITWDERGTWIWVHAEAELPLLDAGLEELLVAALDLPRPEPEEGKKPPKPKRTTASRRKAGLVQEITLEQSAPKKSFAPPKPEPPMVGRSGTRGFKRDKNVTPGSGRKEKKGPF